jgi:hypothetical protein
MHSTRVSELNEKGVEQRRSSDLGAMRSGALEEKPWRGVLLGESFFERHSPCFLESLCDMMPIVSELLDFAVEEDPTWSHYPALVEGLLEGRSID